MVPESRNGAGSLAFFDTLGSKKPPAGAGEPTVSCKATAAFPMTPTQADSPKASRKYPVRRRKSLVGTLREVKTHTEKSIMSQEEVISIVEPIVIHAAPPSAFARAMFGHRSELMEPSDRGNTCLHPLGLTRHFSLYGPGTKVDAFAEPSPDDLILRAQSSKSPLWRTPAGHDSIG